MSDVDLFAATHNDTSPAVEAHTAAPDSSSAEYIQFFTTDPEIVAAIRSNQTPAERKRFVELALRVGVLSLRAAQGTIDGEQIRVNGERLIEVMSERLTGHRQAVDQTLASALRTYFDPESGHFQSRVNALTRPDGELAQLVHSQMTNETARISNVLDQFVGPNGQFTRMLAPGEANPFIAHLRQSVSESLRSQHDAIVGQFSLDQESSALSRLLKELKTNHGDVSEALQTRVTEVVREFSLDSPDSALSRLVARVEQAQKVMTNEFSLDQQDSALSRFSRQIHEVLGGVAQSQERFQQEVIALVSSLQAQRKAEARSTTHGMSFEADVGAVMQLECSAKGDVLTSTGATTGTIRNCKVGDFVVTLGPDHQAAGANIVVEAKADASYSLQSTLAECDEARRNRAAQVCIFVHSTKTAPAEIKETFQRFGNDIVVLWDSDTTDMDILLKLALSVAKALCVRGSEMSKKEAGSWEQIDRSVELVRKQLDGLVELKTSSETIDRANNKSLERIRIMSKNLESALVTLDEELKVLRG